MIRTGFRSKLPAARPAKQWEGDALPGPRAQLVRIDDGRARSIVAIPKGPKAKPGKRAPTKVEREWMDWIVARGCVACRMDGLGIVAACVHHILRGGVRMGHLFTLPLCPDHHVDSGKYIARHPYKARFEKRYGAEMHLLTGLQREKAGIA